MCNCGGYFRRSSRGDPQYYQVVMIAASASEVPCRRMAEIDAQERTLTYVFLSTGGAIMPAGATRSVSTDKQIGLSTELTGVSLAG